MNRPKTIVYRHRLGDTAVTPCVVESNGDAVDLSTATALQFRMGSLLGPGSALKVDRDIFSSITSAADGEFVIPWQAADVDTEGVYWSEVEVTWSDSSTKTYPDIRGVIIRIADIVGP